MNETVITIDFETKDPYITEIGCTGWPYGDVGLLCVGVQVSEILLNRIKTDPVIVFNLQKENETSSFRKFLAKYEGCKLIAHNAQYETGILHMMGIDYTKYTIVDTMIMAFLDYNLRQSFSLDNLAKEIFKEQKSNDLLVECIQECADVLKITKATNLEKLSKTNMDLLYQRYKAQVERYCADDVELTTKLFYHLSKKIDIDYDFYSDLIKACVASRARGVRVDLKRAEKAYNIFIEKSQEHEKKAKEIAGSEINIRSSKQLAEFFDSVGVTYPRTEAGNPSIRTDWHEEGHHPISEHIILAKKYEKAADVFCKKLSQIARFKSKCGRYGYIFPEINLFGARTGRMSCKGPNLQQIPKRDKEIGPICRSMFVPHEDETWYSFDYSSQEQRLQIHYANKFGAPGVDDFVLNLQHIPDIDLHKESSMIMFGDYDQQKRAIVKAINLGLSYGMGQKSLATTLGLSIPEALHMKDKYNEALPYLKYSIMKVTNAAKSKGFVWSLLRRKLYTERDYEYKAYNAVMQGGGLDMLIAAIVNLYRQGIIITIPVHDEINVSVPKIKGTLRESDIVEKIVDSMENTIKLDVPMKVDYSYGNSWAEAK